MLRCCVLVFVIVVFPLVDQSARGADVFRISGDPVKAGDPLLPNAQGLTYKVFAARDEITLRERAEGDAPVGEEMTFLQGAWVVEVFPKNAKQPSAILLATSENGETVSSPLGWASVQELLLDNRPLTAAPGIYKKCLIVNRVDQESNDWELVRLTRGPHQPRSKDEGRPIRLNNVFFVFKESIDKQYLLVGVAATFSQYSGPEKVILGWAPVDRVAYWNTRFGFEWDIRSLQAKAAPRTTPGYVYHTPDLAKKYATAPKEGRDFELAYLFREDTSVAQGRLVPFYRADEPRFIVMGRDDGSASPTVLQQVYELRQHKLFRAGVIGSTTDANKQYREKIRTLIQALRQVQIVFLMDKTEEMEEFLTSTRSKQSAVHRTVGELLEDYRVRLGRAGDEGRELELSLSFYGDQVYSDKPFIMNPLVGIGRSQDLDTQLREFETISGDHGGDAPDSLFDGIEKSLALFNRTGTKRRILIVLGNMGDRIGDDPVRLKAVCDRITAKVIPGLMPIEVYPIQAATDSVLGGHPDAIRYGTHMNSLAATINTAWQTKTKTKDTIAVVTLADRKPDRVASLVKTIADRVKMVEQQNSEALKALRNSQVTGEAQGEGTKGGASTVVGEFLRARLKHNNVPTGVEPDLFAEGYLWQQSFDLEGIIPQVRTVVHVEKAQADNLRTIVTAITGQGAFRVGKRIELDRLSVKILAVLTGDSFDQGVTANKKESASNISDYLAARSLPFQSEFMQALARGESAVLKADDIKHLLLVKDKLGDIDQSRFREYTWERIKLDSGETIQQWVPIKNSTRNVNRVFTIDGDPLQTQYVWLDLFEEVP